MERYIGCSGYYYNHWKGIFYPDKLAKSKWLIYYSEHFNTVELNNTFYRMPEEKAVRNWYEITPAGFVFAVKGYRFITHLKKLTIDESTIDFLERFQHTAALLKEKLGPLLWQLPGNFPANISKLEKFCALLSADFTHVFEFRNSSWFSREVYDVLEKYNHGLCIVSAPREFSGILKLTSPVAYIRFHGKGSWYADNYSNEDLQKWKSILDNLPAEKLYAYFNNDVNGYAVNNGKYLASLYSKGCLFFV